MDSWASLPYYHGLLPGEDARGLLGTDGDFLVRVVELRRDGGNRRQLILTVQTQDAVLELPVDERADGWTIEQERVFATPLELIAAYHSRPLSRARTTTRLRRAVERRDWQLRHSEVTLGDKIGAGAYGTVFRGVLKRSRDKEPTVVAVKRMELAACASKEAIDCLMKEARAMKMYDHPNVVKFFGVVADHPLMLVLELAEHGSVDNYLRQNGDTVEAAARIDMALHAARGLRYLHLMGCIHRDIAARNCLLTRNNVLKISDFGLTRHAEIYKIDVTKPLNVRWLAPEAWSTAATNHKTDVYAFGVLLWELFHKPFALPYEGWQASTVKRKVVEGFRPSTPKDAPPWVIALMKRCWSREPQHRPRFDDIVHYVRTRGCQSSSSGSTSRRRSSPRQPGTIRVRKYQTD